MEGGGGVQETKLEKAVKLEMGISLVFVFM